MIELLVDNAIFLGQVFLLLIATNFIFNLITRSSNHHEDLEELDQRLTELRSLIHQVKVEKHQDIYYWFDEDTDAFLGQGKDFTSVIYTVKDRFPKHIFLLTVEDELYSIQGPDWKLVPVPVIGSD
jgi:hypothetical protein